MRCFIRVVISGLLLLPSPLTGAHGAGNASGFESDSTFLRLISDLEHLNAEVFALKACVLSDSKNALSQVQALCISNWKRVVEAREKEFPGLRDELSRSKNLIPPDAQRLIDASNAMLKPSGDE